MISSAFLSAVCEVEDQPSGLGFDSRGRLLVVAMVDRRVLRLEGDQLVEVADLSSCAPFHCNDMLVDGRGRAYVGNFGWDDAAAPLIRSTVLLRVDADGTSSVAASDLVFPNGMVITPDGRTLIVSETFAGRITAFDVAEDGSLSNRRVWADFAGSSAWETISEAVGSGALLPDGLALDAEGALWVGHAAGHGATRVREGGEILEFVDTGELAVFAVALGGSDRRTLYMCASPPLLSNDPSVDHRARLLTCRVDIPRGGLP